MVVRRCKKQRAFVVGLVMVGLVKAALAVPLGVYKVIGVEPEANQACMDFSDRVLVTAVLVLALG